MRRAGGDASMMQRINTVAVLRTLHGADQVTLRDLADAAGVSRNTAEDAATTLVTAGFAEEVTPESDARRVGRPAKRYRFRADAGYVLGVDLAVHEVNVLVTDLRGTERGRETRTLDPDAPTQDRVAAAREVLRDAIRITGIREDRVLAVGAATTGIVDHGGTVVLSNRLPQAQGRNLVEDLTVLPDVPVIVGNDARLATLAERWVGTAHDIDDFVNIIAGRHITAGVVLGGQLLRGAHGAAGEIGVLPEARWQAALDAIAAWPDGPEATVAAAAAGKIDAAVRVDKLAELLATGIAAIVLAVDPRCVVLSGGLSRAGEILLRPLQAHLDAKTLFPIPIRASTLDHKAVALGAVRLALDHVEQDLFDIDSSRFAAKLNT